MKKTYSGSEIEHLIQLLARLPGLGPRSARRATLHLLKKKDSLLKPLGSAIDEVVDKVRICSTCGNVDTSDPCFICSDPQRDNKTIIVVEEVSDLWALERTGAMQTFYHILGGHLSPLDGIGPDDLNMRKLYDRVASGTVTEVILAMNATVEGQTTAHYITDHLSDFNVQVTRLAHGVPIGGELDYLDDGTLAQALRARTRL